MDKLSVTIKEATEMTGIGRTSLYGLFKSGALTPRKRGSQTLILVEELEAYLKSLPVADAKTSILSPEEAKIALAAQAQELMMGYESDTENDGVIKGGVIL